MNREIRGNDWQAACHRLHQGVCKGFRIGRSDVDVGAPIKMMELTIWDRSQLNHEVRYTQRFHQPCRAGWIVGAWIRAGSQLAGNQKPKRPVLQTLSQERQCAEQSFEVPVLVVVTDKQKPETSLRLLQLLLGLRFQWSRIAEECPAVESVMNG